MVHICITIVLQCDKSTDVAQCSQLLVFIRFLNDNKTFKRSCYFIKNGEGSDVMDIISQHFEIHEIMWQNLAGFCTEGAPAIFPLLSCSFVKKKKNNPQ